MNLTKGIDMIDSSEENGLEKFNVQVETNVDPQLIRKNLKEAQQQIIQNYILMNFTDDNVPLKTFMMDLEKQLISFSLSVTRGNQRRTAHLLGIKETTLCEKIRKYRIKKSGRAADNNVLELENFSRLVPHLNIRTAAGRIF